jgi:hypothetical protein
MRAIVQSLWAVAGAFSATNIPAAPKSAVPSFLIETSLALTTANSRQSPAEPQAADRSMTAAR